MNESKSNKKKIIYENLKKIQERMAKREIMISE
jgi:hypothetical protein